MGDLILMTEFLHNQLSELKHTDVYNEFIDFPIRENSQFWENDGGADMEDCHGYQIESLRDAS